MSNYRYWYFRFTKDFFDDSFIDTLKDVPVYGYQYIVIYLEICALSLKQGREYLVIPRLTSNCNYVNYIAEHIREEYKIVDAAIELFKRYRYIEIIEKESSFEIKIPKLTYNTGVSSKNADRVRMQRQKQDLLAKKDEVGQVEDKESKNIKDSPFAKFL